MCHLRQQHQGDSHERITDFVLSQPLELGESLTQSEVEELFETNFGYQFRWITPRAPDEGRYLILLANEGEIYDDDLSGGDTFIYFGEGVREKSDQKETAANKALSDAIHDPLPIHLFTSTEGVDDYDYRGIVSVEDYAYVSDGQRMVYKFQIKRFGFPSWEGYQQIDTDIEQHYSTNPASPKTRSTHQQSRPPD